MSEDEARKQKIQEWLAEIRRLRNLIHQYRELLNSK